MWQLSQSSACTWAPPEHPRAHQIGLWNTALHCFTHLYIKSALCLEVYLQVFNGYAGSHHTDVATFTKASPQEVWIISRVGNSVIKATINNHVAKTQHTAYHLRSISASGITGQVRHMVLKFLTETPKLYL